MPANLSVSEPEKNSVTELDGTNIKRGGVTDGSTFTPEGLKVTTPPHPGGGRGVGWHAKAHAPPNPHAPR